MRVARATLSVVEGRQTPPDLLPAPLVNASGLRKRWGRSAVPVLDDVDLTMNAGELVAIVGRNGVGKTTLLRILSGLIEPDAGTVTVAGLRARADRRAFHTLVAFLPAANTGLYVRLTVRQNLELWSDLALVPRRRRRAAVDAAIDRFELGDLAGRRADRLSMGQRQRVRLALTTLHEPRVLLLDEATNSLDDEGVAVLLGVVEEIRRNAGCVVWCAPKIDEHELRVDRRLTLRDGRLA
jgi:ABC-type multidrug transport system ATPase subunit